MFFPIAGLILILAGFALSFLKKKIPKDNDNLRYADIKEVEKNENGGWNVRVEYRPERNGDTEFETFNLKRKPRNDHLILELNPEDETSEIYAPNRALTYLQLGLFVVGGLLCLL